MFEDFKRLARKSPPLALAALGLFALAVETAQKPTGQSAAPLPASSRWPSAGGTLAAPLPSLQASTLTSTPFSTLFSSPAVTNRWDAHGQRLLDTHPDSDGDGLVDGEEGTGLGLLEVLDGQALHAFGPGARVLSFPTPADRECRALDLPFEFPFASNLHSRAFVHVDGVLGFGYPSLPGRPAAMPFANPWPSALLAPFWADLALDPVQGRVWTLPLTDLATGATNGCVVAWEGLRLGTNQASSVSFQAELRADGRVRFLHGAMDGVDDPGLQAVVGVQAGPSGWSFCAFEPGLVLPGRALRLEPTLRTTRWWTSPPQTVGYSSGLRDSDGDGTADGVEWYYNARAESPRQFLPQPLRWADDPLDFDNDGLDNHAEYAAGLDALWFDTDRDGLPDGWERDRALDPRSASGADGAEGDPDSDGRTNAAEFREQTDPRQADAPPSAPAEPVWVRLRVRRALWESSYWGPRDADPVSVAFRGVGAEAGRAWAFHDEAASGGTDHLDVPLAPGGRYLLETRVQGPWGADAEQARHSTHVEVLAGETGGDGLLAVFTPPGQYPGQVDVALDAGGPAWREGAPPGDFPPGTSVHASVVVVCGTAPLHVDMTWATGLRAVFGPGGGTNEFQLLTVTNGPPCGLGLGAWSVERLDDPEGPGEDGILLLPVATNAWQRLVGLTPAAVPGTYEVVATCDANPTNHNCRVAHGTVTVASVVRIGLDVTDDEGTGGPDGDMADAGDDLARYLPGERNGVPVIRWDKENSVLVPQHLQVRIEAYGDHPYTNAQVNLSSNPKPGWCTNTREPSDDPAEKEIKANWQTHDFSLSETGLLSQTNLAFAGESAVAVADLFCRDYGGKARVTVVFEDAQGTSVTQTFTVPLDDDNDGLADRWETEAAAGWADAFGTNAAAVATSLFGLGGTQEPADPDGPRQRAAHAAGGDGLSAWDEYRGFSLPGTGHPHRRLWPLRKEMVVWVEAATTNDVPAASAGEVASAMERVVDVFDRDLAMSVLWARSGSTRSVDNTVTNLDHLLDLCLPRDGDDFGHPLHTATRSRRFVFTVAVPLDSDGTRLNGAVNALGGRSGVLDAAALRRDVDPASDDPVRHFFAVRGVTAAHRFATVAVHEFGHFAGCSGDASIYANTAAISVYGSGPSGERYSGSVSNAPHQAYLVLARAGWPPDAVLPFHGQVERSVAQLAADIDALEGYGASVDPATAELPAASLDLWKGFSFGNGLSGAAGVDCELGVNGVMTYNSFSSTRHTDPAFDNAAGSAAGGPLKRLFEVEVGSVRVEVK